MEGRRKIVERSWAEKHLQGPDGASCGLLTDELEELRRFEAKLSRGVLTFLEEGEFLAVVRDQRLDRREFRSFSDYCRKKLYCGRAYGYQLIRAAEVMRWLSEGGKGRLPQNEAQVRPLIGLEPQKVREVWAKALEACPNERVPARLVKELVSADNRERQLSSKPELKRCRSRLWKCFAKLEAALEKDVSHAELRKGLAELKRVVYRLVKAKS